MKILVGYDGRRRWNWLKGEPKPIRQALKWFLQWPKIVNRNI